MAGEGGRSQGSGGSGSGARGGVAGKGGSETGGAGASAESGAGGDSESAGNGGDGGEENGAAGNGGATGASGGTGGDAGGSGGAGGDPEPVRDARCDGATPDELTGTGETDDPFLICLAEQLALLGPGDYPLGDSFALGDELDLANLDPEFETIGSAEQTFTGVLDGRGHALTGLSRALLAAVGAGGEVRDLSVTGGLDASMEPTSFGLLTLRNLGTIRNVHMDGTLIAGSHVGLLTGTNEGTVEHCSARGTISDGGAHVGGLIGVNVGTVRRSWSTVSVTAAGRVGGLVGRQSAPGLIEQSFSLGEVEGGVTTGGLLGSLFGGEVRDSYARASSVRSPEAGGLVGDVTGSGISITRCYSAAQTLDGAGAEGLVGEVGASSDYVVTASYFLDTATGTLGSALTSSELQSSGSFEGWDFTGIWQFDAALSAFPSLRFE
jgi:hypothetical protein